MKRALIAAVLAMAMGAGLSWAKLPAPPAQTDEQKAACVRNVREATMMRRLYLDGVWRTFVEKAAEKKLAA